MICSARATLQVWSPAGWKHVILAPKWIRSSKNEFLWAWVDSMASANTHTGHTSDAPIYENHNPTGSTHGRCCVWGFSFTSNATSSYNLNRIFHFYSPPFACHGTGEYTTIKFCHAPWTIRTFYHLQKFYGHFLHFREREKESSRHPLFQQEITWNNNRTLILVIEMRISPHDFCEQKPWS